MASLCLAPIRGDVLRIVKEDVCGVPVTGAASAQVVSAGFVSIDVDPNYELQGAIRERLANGSLCVNEPDVAQLLEIEVAINFCLVDPDIAAITMGATLITGGPPVTGTGFALREGIITARWSLEVWQPTAGASACDPSGLPQRLYHAFPNLGSAQLGSFTIENGRLNFQITARTKAGSLLWGNGPGSAGPWTASILSGTHYLANYTTVATPAIPADCGAFALV